MANQIHFSALADWVMMAQNGFVPQSHTAKALGKKHAENMKVVLQFYVPGFPHG